MSRRRIFVFGSNLRGIHGAGSAKFAADYYGAEHGAGEGLTGESYALPTCGSPGEPLDLWTIGEALERFADFAKAHPEMDFLLTAIGCGFAGYTPTEISRQLPPDMPDNIYVQAKLAQAIRE